MSSILSARIIRRQIPPEMAGPRGYERAKDGLRADFTYRCAYCGVREEDNGGENFEIDHFCPVSRGGAVNDYANLYWSCSGCNAFKSNKWPNEEMELIGVRLLDPCREWEFPQHLLEDESGILQGRTKAGRYHIDCLRLNRRSRVDKRQDRNELMALHDQAQSFINEMSDEIKDTEEFQLLVRVLDGLRDRARMTITIMR